MPALGIPPHVRDEALRLWVEHGRETGQAYLWREGYKISDNGWARIITQRDRVKFPRSNASARRLWTIDELAYLNTHYGSATREEMVVHLNRSWMTIFGKAKQLGLSRRKFDFKAVNREITRPTLYGAMDSRMGALIQAWDGVWNGQITPSFTVNSQWYLVPSRTKDPSNNMDRLQRYIRNAAMNVAIFNPDLPYMVSQRGRHWGMFVPHALILVPGPDGIVRGWNLEPTMDLEALARVYGPAVRLPKKRTIHMPKPGRGRPRKDHALV